MSTASVTGHSLAGQTPSQTPRRTDRGNVLPFPRMRGQNDRPNRTRAELTNRPAIDTDDELRDLEAVYVFLPPGSPYRELSENEVAADLREVMWQCRKRRIQRSNRIARLLVLGCAFLAIGFALSFLLAASLRSANGVVLTKEAAHPLLAAGSSIGSRDLPTGGAEKSLFGDTAVLVVDDVGPVTVRSGPTTSTPALDKVDAGTALTVVCTVKGETVGGASDTWMKVSTGGWVSATVISGGAPAGLLSC